MGVKIYYSLLHRYVYNIPVYTTSIYVYNIPVYTTSIYVYNIRVYTTNIYVYMTYQGFLKLRVGETL